MLHAEMNSACSSHGDEEQAKRGGGSCLAWEEQPLSRWMTRGWGGVDGELGRCGCLVAAWLPMVELVFVVVYMMVLLIFSPEKAAVVEVERAAEG